MLQITFTIKTIKFDSRNIICVVKSFNRYIMHIACLLGMSLLNALYDLFGMQQPVTHLKRTHLNF